MQFITGEHDAFVVEDADHILASRSSCVAAVMRALKARKILLASTMLMTCSALPGGDSPSRVQANGDRRAQRS